MLVTLADSVRPSTSKRIGVADVDAESLVQALFDRHFAIGRRGLVPHLAGDDALVALERRAIGDRVFARQRASPAHVLVVLQLQFPALRRL